MDPISGKVIADVAWHAVKRTVAVVLVLSVIVGIPWVAYEKGKTKGYSLCHKDKSTYTGENITVFEGEKKPLFLGMKLGKIGLGLIWDRNK